MTIEFFEKMCDIDSDKNTTATIREPITTI